ncbi:MAG: acyltransferase family protein [Rhodothermales bacterium]
MTRANNTHPIRIHELDTLRALAISLVLFFHLDFPGFEFGYLGVDLFFLLSGYLMTKIIMREYDIKGQYDALGFLIKRFWRLAPSFVTVTSICLIVCTLIFSPDPLAGIGAQIKYAFLLTSNTFFYSQAGYFAPENELRPFLHTWSLSVEEQFYLLFACALVLARWIKLVYVIGFLFTLGLMLWLGMIWQINTTTQIMIASPIWPNLEKSEEAIFYLMPFRIFQVTGGCLLAFATSRSKLVAIKGMKSILIVVLAVGLIIIGPLFDLSNYTALFVTFSGALLILPNNFTAAIGHFYFVQFLAKISYQLYLIHWPVIVLWRYLTLDEISLFESFCLGGISIILGWFLWFLTKDLSFRSISEHTPKLALRITSAIILGGILCFSFAIFIQENNGLTWRVSDKKILKTEKEMRADETAYCDSTDADNLNLDDNSDAQFITCRANSGKIDKIYTFGDSHARHLVAGLVENFPDHEINILYRSSCHAQSGIKNYVYEHKNRKAKTDGCIERNNQALDFFENVAQPSTIIIHQYAGYAGDQSKHFMGAAEELIKRLQKANHQVVWIGPVIRPGKQTTDCRAMPYTFPIFFLTRRQCQGDRVLAKNIINYSIDLQQRFPSVFLNISKFFCFQIQPEPSCRILTAKKESLFRDKHHLTIQASTELISYLIHNQQLTIKNHSLESIEVPPKRKP